MNTDKNVAQKFCSLRQGIGYNLLKMKLQEININEVVFSLLKYNFMVEINGSRYDLMFGVSETGEISCNQTYYPNSEPLTSHELIEKSFREGKWFYLTDIHLTDEELLLNKGIIEGLEISQEMKKREGLVDRLLEHCVNDNESKLNDIKDVSKKYLMSLSKDEFCKYIFKSQ